MPPLSCSPLNRMGTSTNSTNSRKYARASWTATAFGLARTASTVVPGSPFASTSVTEMVSVSVDNSVLRTEDRVRWPVTADSLSTTSSVATPKLAMAPMPNVPTTPAALAASVFLPLLPAYQKLVSISLAVMPIPLSVTVTRASSTTTAMPGSKSGLCTIRKQIASNAFCVFSRSRASGDW